jgi:hypothetical protein
MVYVMSDDSTFRSQHVADDTAKYKHLTGDVKAIFTSERKAPASCAT